MVIGRALAFGALAVADLVLAVLILVAAVPMFGLGMIFMFPPVVRVVRWRTRLARKLNGAWLETRVRAPYLPPPPPTRPQPDGWYRYQRQLYKTPRWPDWNNRWKWMFGDPATWRDGLWMLLNPLVAGVFLLPFAVLARLLATPWHPVSPATLPAAGVAVALLAALPWLLRGYAWWNRLLLSPTATSILAGQLQRLDQARLETVDSQAAELRRIERDLHDGAQARLVAMGMTLGAVEELMDKDPAAAKALLGKVREASSAALTELRDLVRGIHPPVLAERGLGDAVRALALDSPLKARVTVDLGTRPEPPVESAAYFSISELLTNAARHGGAERVWIDISAHDGALRVTVTDDGSGGADPSRGSGLRGIERRLAAFDGVLAVSSPPGGPTTATIDLPGALDRKVPDCTVMPRWKTAVVAIGWGLGWLPLFPQGLIAMILKLAGTDRFSWFLALYLPEPWQWPLIVFNIVLGVSLYTAAIFIPIHHSRHRWMAEAAPTRLWLGR
ncbi:signal transduction histidine kinase [Streptosporangium becharense]|uniref:histidine kinase n=1 Tax=Streptosporangium becharense TaxID=1816182 RepID=A0A7W9MGU6_9ACTN|nr:sensor histidine kinase [Streptosporangium becharense]MBB2912689.1 signal transduction histidine kinase [Streptosporangium becharense]MBB5820482.1 signal transduction histidine kinase [Streptosporangium becharense]